MAPIPKKCRAAVVLDGKLTLGETELPALASRQLLIQMHAIGVNHADVYQRQGKYPVPPGASPILGLELSGEIVAVGSDVRSYRVGQRVMALVTGGAYADYCVADEQTTLPIPDALSYEEAAAIPESYFTIWSNVFDLKMAGLVAGETLLVHGGTSGVGSSTIQLAKLAGATVITTAGSPEKVAACLALGADLAIPYKEQDFAEVIPKFLGGKGVDVIFDWIGAKYFAKHIQLLNRFGRLVIIDTHTGGNAELDLRKLYAKNAYVMGSVLRRRPIEEKERICQEVEKLWMPALTAGKLKPKINGAFPLSQAQAAHDLMEKSGHIGKILLTP